jgi:N-acyl homoserine lactone hydrolase
MGEKTRVKRMFVLDGGSFLYESSMMTYGSGIGKKIRIFTPFFAFDTEEGWILYDTGMPENVVEMYTSFGLEPIIGEENFAPEQLAKINVLPRDVTRIIISHLHMDHAGGLQHFPDTEVYVQKDEYAYALHPNSFQRYEYQQENFNLPEIKYNFLEGDEVIMPGLTAILANGHSPGLQGLVIELPGRQFVILGSDAIYLQKNIDRNLPPGQAWNMSQALYSVKRLKALQCILNAQLLPGHDFEYYTERIKVGESIGLT